MRKFLIAFAAVFATAACSEACVLKRLADRRQAVKTTVRTKTVVKAKTPLVSGGCVSGKCPLK